MRKNFDYFVKKIPVNIHNNTKSIVTSHIAIFIPENFVIDKLMYVEEYHFVICFTTPPRVTIRSKEYQFKKGSLICMTPGDDILVHPFNSSSPVKYMTVCVNKEFMQKIHQQTGGEGDLLFKKPNNTYSHQLLEGIEALIYEVLNYKNTNSLMIESLENRIAIQLLRDSNSEFNEAGYTKQNLQDVVQKAIKYIETYYSSNITIRNICDAIYISPPHLQKVFLKCVGITPYQYIMDCRHRRAKEMLETTRLPIEEIARQCGFVNNAHFSTTFKQKEGMSPLAYRKSFLRDE
ncbi:MAG: AraC family transcriptional regulator [Firmicutes bacterium]|nr:AraC family transcriptional regulator [Bacillota bacterium]MDD4264114.1 AraC family transcriptional regulator [Bacillota bacterium]MDD4694150.1 AraC family transcriptional regulator [Bacillota bacterium]